jgi:hypothetical protein
MTGPKPFSFSVHQQPPWCPQTDNLAKGALRLIFAGMAEKKPEPKPDDAYTDEEAARRTDATIRAMIGMKPKPHTPPKPPGLKQGTERKSQNPRRKSTP